MLVERTNSLSFSPRFCLYFETVSVTLVSLVGDLEGRITANRNEIVITYNIVIK